MLISAVIVVVDNDYDYLDSCIKSLITAAENVYIDIEFIIVFNAVVTKKINRFKKNFSGINIKYLINSKNFGFGTAVNAGMKHSSSNWCIIACPDTTADKQCIKILYNHLKKTDVAIIAPQVVLSDNSIQPTILPEPSICSIFTEQTYLYKLFPELIRSPFSYKKLYFQVHTVNAVAAIWWLVNNKIFQIIGGFDSSFFLYFEDVDFCKRICKRGYKIIYDPHAIVRHSPHQSTGGETSGRLYYRSLSKFLFKYHDFLYSFLCLLIYRLGCRIRLIYWGIDHKFRNKSNDAAFSLNKIKFFQEVLSSK